MINSDNQSETIAEGKYLYGIIQPVPHLLGDTDDTVKQQTFETQGIGTRGDRVYIVWDKNIGALVSNSPMIRYSPKSDNFLAHEKVLEEAMQFYTVLPVRFCTIAESEEKIKKILQKEFYKFHDLLKNMEGKKEFGIKAVFNEGSIYQDILNNYPDIKEYREKLATNLISNKHAHLMKIGEMVETALKNEVSICHHNIIDHLSPLAEEVHINNTYGERTIINAAFLVEEKKEDEFSDAVNKLAGNYGTKIKFKYVGTIPPYNFVNLTIHMENY